MNITSNTAPVKADINAEEEWAAVDPDRAIGLTFFPNEFAKEKVLGYWKLSDLAAVIPSEVQGKKQWTPWLHPAVFGEQKSDADCYRHDENVEILTGIPADYDTGTGLDGTVHSFEYAQLCVRRAGVAALLYKTPSDTPDEPRWRVICPLSHDYVVSDLAEAKQFRHQMNDRVNGMLGGGLDPGSWDLSRSYHFGSVAGKPPVEAVYIPGDYIDLRPDLDAGAIGKGGKRGPSEVHEPRSAPEGLVECDDDADLLREAEERIKWKIENPKDSHRTATGNGTRTLANWLLDMRAGDKILSIAKVAELIVDSGWALDGTAEDITGTTGTPKRTGIVERVAEARESDRGCEDILAKPADGYPTEVVDWEAVAKTQATAATQPVLLVEQVSSAPPAAIPDEAPAGTESAMASHFAERFHRELHYVHRWGWLSYDGVRWKRDEMLSVWRLAKRIADQQAWMSQKDSERRKLASKATINAIADLARSDPRIITAPDAWDSREDWFNTPTGTVDLTTGELRGHQWSDLTTKVAATGPGGNCPRWLQFIDEVTAGDKQLAWYLQKLLGYCLTGSIKEQALFFLHGGGANGKGVFLNTASEICGDYAKVAPADMFVDSQNERHPTDMAGLQGARLVTAQEIEDGKYWAEAKLKMLTGGDLVTARFMRQDFFTYVPQFKLLIAANHKPRLRNVGEAIRRRLHLIPFTVTIPSEKRDLDLMDKLRAEHPGILAWAIEGCIGWQREGLKRPAAVKDATEEYLAEQDPLRDWEEDCIERNRDAGFLSRRALFKSYERYAQAAGEKPRGQKAFCALLRASGWEEHKAHGERGFKGVAWNAVPDAAVHDFQP